MAIQKRLPLISATFSSSEPQIQHIPFPGFLRPFFKPGNELSHLINENAVIVYHNYCGLGTFAEVRHMAKGSDRLIALVYHHRVNIFNISQKDKEPLTAEWGHCEEDSITEDIFQSSEFQAKLRKLSNAAAWFKSLIYPAENQLKVEGQYNKMADAANAKSVACFIDSLADELNLAAVIPTAGSSLCVIFDELNVEMRLDQMLELYQFLLDYFKNSHILPPVKSELEQESDKESGLLPPSAGSSAPDNTADEDFEEKIRDVPEKIKDQIIALNNKLKTQKQCDTEHAKEQTYLDWLVRTPWNKSTVETSDLTEVEKVLEEDHYGLNEVKDRIAEFIAVKFLNKKTRCPILCLIGPPGVGKTSLGKSIARATNRDFIRMSVGGLSDIHEIKGHTRTYIGALPGRIMQKIVCAGTNNPVFMIDEIDKIGLQGFSGNPESAFLEVLDPEQNNSFEDIYYGPNLQFDLSSTFFVTTANTCDTIMSALKDRMEIITIRPYTTEEKLQIAKKFLVSKQFIECGLNEENLAQRHISAQPPIFSDEALLRIITAHTKEDGVRNLEKGINAILRKIAKAVIIITTSKSPTATLQSLQQIPAIITPDFVDYCLKKPAKLTKIGFTAEQI